MKSLAQQHGLGSWEVLQAYLNLVLPVPSAEPASGTHSDDQLSQHAADGVEHKTNGVSSPAKASFEAARVSHHSRLLCLAPRGSTSEKQVRHSNAWCNIGKAAVFASGTTACPNLPPKSVPQHFDLQSTGLSQPIYSIGHGRMGLSF